MKTRFTITCYDEESLKCVKDGIVTLPDIIQATEETGHCLSVYSNGLRVFSEVTKAGYKCAVHME
jgi:hypothetical protein